MREKEMEKLEFDNIIKNKNELIAQLESLKEEAVVMLRGTHEEIFQKDLHALRIILRALETEKGGR